MNHDPTRRAPGDEPTPIGGALRPVEERLRSDLAADAGSIAPTDRLGAILAEANTPVAISTSTRRWLAPVAAAAAALVVAGSVYAVTRPGDQTPVVAGTATSPATTLTTSQPNASGPSSVPTVTSSVASSAPSAPPSSTPATKPPVSVTTSVPVYYTGPSVEGASDLRLFREFVTAPVASPVSPDTRALTALTLAMGVRPAGSAYVPLWGGVTPVRVVVGLDHIVVELSGALRGVTAEVGATAVQQLVWTAQAAAAKGTLPVSFTVGGDGSEVAPGQPVAKRYNRPTDQTAVYGLLAPIWVDEPYRGQVAAPGPLTVKGVASTFEANVEWQLLEDGTEVQKGSTTAKAGAPARGAFRFTTKPLTSGSYVVRVLESSPKDGSVANEQRIPFSVK